MTGFDFGFMLPVLGLFVVHLWGLWNFLSLISQICRLPSISSVWVAKVGILFLLVQVLLDFVCRINDDNGYNSTFQSENMMTSLMLVMLAVSICATSCFLNIIVMFFQC
jgi:hypothetical protein